MVMQRQIRGAAQATQEARTLAVRELDINTTDKRLCVHDGSTVGGIPHLTFADAQNQEFTYAAASGTNSLTITLARAPAAYAAGQKFAFKAANNNTGSATLNVNSLGAKTLKKITSSGLATLDADEIISGGIYECTYDGTDLVLTGSIGNSTGVELIDEVDLNGINLAVVPLDGKAYKSARIEFENADCGGAFYTRLWLGGSEYTGSQYYHQNISFTGVSSGNLTGAFNSTGPVGQWEFNGPSSNFVSGEFWINHLQQKYPSMQGFYHDDNRVAWKFSGVINVTASGVPTDFQIGRSGSSNFAAGSKARVWGYL